MQAIADFRNQIVIVMHGGDNLRLAADDVTQQPFNLLARGGIQTGQRLIK